MVSTKRRKSLGRKQLPKMHSNNISGALPKGAEIRMRKSSEIWSAYDGLPRNLKKLYDSLPIKCDPVEVAELCEKFGPLTAERIIVQVMQENFLGWGPSQNG